MSLLTEVSYRPEKCFTYEYYCVCDVCAIRVWRSDDSSVGLVLSAHLYVGYWSKLRLVGFCLLIH